MSTQRPKVLVLHNDPEFLVLLERVLEEEGLDTTTTWDPGAAATLLGSACFDAVLVGEHPPEISLKELLNRLEENQRCPMFIALESDAPDPRKEQYLCAIGAYAVISKSDGKRIVDTVREGTGNRGEEKISA